MLPRRCIRSACPQPLHLSYTLSLHRFPTHFSTIAPAAPVGKPLPSRADHGYRDQHRPAARRPPDGSRRSPPKPGDHSNHSGEHHYAQHQTPKTWTKEQLTKHICNMASTSELSKAASEIRRAEANGTPPGPHAYLALALAWGKTGNYSMLEYWIEHMKEKGLATEEECQNAYLSCYAAAHSTARAERVFEQMAKSGVKPSERAVGALVKAYCIVEEMDKALKCVKKALSMGLVLDSSKFPPVFNMIASAYLKAGRIADAETYVAGLEQQGWKPDEVTYAAFLGYHARAGNQQRVQEIFARAREAEIPLTHPCWHAVIGGFGMAHRNDLALAYFDEMRKTLPPTSVTFGILKMYRMSASSSAPAKADTEPE